MTFIEEQLIARQNLQEKLVKTLEAAPPETPENTLRDYKITLMNLHNMLEVEDSGLFTLISTFVTVVVKPQLYNVASIALTACVIKNMVGEEGLEEFTKGLDKVLNS